MATSSTRAGTRPDITLKLSQLQNLCKRDPDGYRSDYDAQILRLQSECDILSLSHSARPPTHLSELIQFAAAVSSSSYVKECENVSCLLVKLLLGKSTKDPIPPADLYKATTALTLPTSSLALHKDVRKSCVSALILMRNKGKLPPLHLLQLFFRMMAVIPDKGLREQLYKHIINDIRNINANGKREETVNRRVQGFLHKVVSFTVPVGNNKNNRDNLINMVDNDATCLAAKRAVLMTRELYRRRVWTDERTVAILATGVESMIPNVAAASMRFFLGIEEKMADDKKREEEDEWYGVQGINFHKHSKKTKGRIRQVGKQVKKRMKEQKKREMDYELETNDPGVEVSKKLYPAIQLLRDPQGLAESVLKRLQKTGANGYRFELKVLAMNFVTRLVGNHELHLLQLYPFLRRYMGGHQRDVTAVLAYAVQSCHNTVPSEEVHGLLKTIVHNFVTERCSGEQIAVGINACRAICARVPSALVVEDDDAGFRDEFQIVAMDTEAFAKDLASYAKHRDRSVSISGRAWLNFIRETYPSLLAGKDRGKEGSALHRAGEKPLRYGEQSVPGGVAGADLLVEYESKKAAYLKKKAEEEDADNNEEVEEMNEDPKSAEASDEDDVVANDVHTEDIEQSKEEEEDGDDEVAPNLVVLKEAPEMNNEQAPLDLSKMTKEERSKLQQDVSSSRIFTASDFVKMRKLIERQEQAKRDPRMSAKLKRRQAEGNDFEELSDDDEYFSDMDSDEDEHNVHVKGAVNPSDIMAESKKKRANKVERIQKILAGRDKFEFNHREGGSTNAEKKRKKNFLMTKYSYENRSKQGSKETARRGTLKKDKKNRIKQDNKKRRRKM